MASRRLVKTTQPTNPPQPTLCALVLMQIVCKDFLASLTVFSSLISYKRRTQDQTWRRFLLLLLPMHGLVLEPGWPRHLVDERHVLESVRRVDALDGLRSQDPGLLLLHLHQIVHINQTSRSKSQITKQKLRRPQTVQSEFVKDHYLTAKWLG